MKIYTRKPNNYFSIEFAKAIARKILHKKRGPQAVIASLLRGLNELRYPYELNVKEGETDIVYVNESLAALRWTIRLKRAGKIKRLIAGPNLVVAPVDYDQIAFSQEIDIYLVPSQWIFDFYASFGNKEFNKKMRIWPAGVSLPAQSLNKRDTILVYKKNVSDDIFNSVINELEKRGFAYEVLRYGHHQRKTYLDLLNRSRALIYLQLVESQGVALLEAWAHNVPSLVFDNQKYYFEHINKTVYGNVSAPYLNSQCGMFFQIDNFAASLDTFLANLATYSPRTYVEENFIDRICAEKFLQIIKSIK